jgi:hypothetical protein
MKRDILHWRSIVVAVAVGALSLTAGCAGSATKGARFVGGPSSAASHGASGAKPSDPPKPTAVRQTGACPLLSAAELKKLLGGGGSQTKLRATEDKPDPSGGFTTYTCLYGSKGTNPFALAVSDYPPGDLTPAKVIHDIATGAKVATHSVAGVGEAAVFYSLPDNTSILAAAKQSQGKVRGVVFAAPVIVPKQKFIDVEKLVLGRM